MPNTSERDIPSISLESRSLVSVIMAAYNAEQTIAEAVQSLLIQTYPHFELILIDDGSTDKTSDILKTFEAQDSRVKIITQENIGLTKSLNRGLNMAAGKYIARQDADDYSYPDRLEKQVTLMEENPDIVLCGTNCDNAYANGMVSEWGHKSEQSLKSSITFKTPFAHSTAMFRTDTARKFGGYDESFVTSQDMEFWIRLSQHGRVVMLEQPLIKRHIIASSVSIKRRWRQTYDAFRARWIHNKNKALVVYHTGRSFLISLLPDALIATKQGLKHE